MDELIKSIMKQYVSIRMDENDSMIDLRELKVFLGMLDATTLGDISADLRSYRKENI